jgi:hypothetical protein
MPRPSNTDFDQLHTFVGVVVSIPALLVAGFLGFMHDWTIGWFLLLVLALPGVLRLSLVLTRRYRSRTTQETGPSEEQPFWRFPLMMGLLTFTFIFAVYRALDFIIGP